MENVLDSLMPEYAHVLRVSSVSENIDRLEAEMAECETLEIPVKHGFPKGLYVREVVVPADTLLTSKIHKTEYVYVVSKGRILVFTEGDGVVEIAAPYTGFSSPGARRVCHALEDTVWTTIHPNPTNETDIDTLESELFQPPGDHLKCRE